ncbi:MAG: cardiolipin synthase, partial [Muribaculaceae bacterium]|nr:cardiolipin synthase [Muribaculaceae bacterium]
GPGVAALRYSFAVDWSFMGQPLDLDSESAGHPQCVPAGSDQAGSRHNTLPASVQLVTSGPTDRWSNVELILLKAIGAARKRVWIQTPYFLPPESMLRALQTAALARVDVRVMMPQRSDSAILTYASRSYISECLRAGMKFYLFSAGMLHSKVVIVDDDFSSVGSANIDFRSFEHNFESNLMIYGTEVNSELRRLFSDDMSRSLRLRLQVWARRPLHHKAAESIMRLLSPVL